MFGLSCSLHLTLSCYPANYLWQKFTIPSLWLEIREIENRIENEETNSMARNEEGSDQIY